MLAEGRLTARARTNWRRLIAWALLVIGTTLGLYFGVSSKITHEIAKRRGPPCVRDKDGRPSEGCRRIARLVAEQCELEPKLCRPIVRVIIVSPQGRRLVQLELKRILRARPPAPRSGNGRITPPRRSPSGQNPGDGRGDGPGSPPPIVPAPQTPSPPPAPSPVQRPPSDVINDTTGHAVEQGNAVLCQVVHVCGALPTPPQVPPLPPLP